MMPHPVGVRLAAPERPLGTGTGTRCDAPNAPSASLISAGMSRHAPSGPAGSRALANIADRGSAPLLTRAVGRHGLTMSRPDSGMVTPKLPAESSALIGSHPRGRPVDQQLGAGGWPSLDEAELGCGWIDVDQVEPGVGQRDVPVGSRS